MTAKTTPPLTDDRYYLSLLSAFVRGVLRLGGDLTDRELAELGQAHGLRLHKFKRSTLPRVRRVIGALRGLAPEDLLDVGSGRGTFLWPLLDAFPSLQVTAIDREPQRAEDLVAVAQGGLSRLNAHCMNVTSLEWESNRFDTVSILEVLEHLPEPLAAAREVVRVARRFVVASVPSQPDDNPEHIHLFSQAALRSLFRQAGAAKVSVDYVLNHMIAVVRV